MLFGDDVLISDVLSRRKYFFTSEDASSPRRRRYTFLTCSRRHVAASLSFAVPFTSLQKIHTDWWRRMVRLLLLLVSLGMSLSARHRCSAPVTRPTVV